MDNVGSLAVWKAIDKYQPLLGMHVHIHESRGTYNPGRTFCTNPRSECTEGILRSVPFVIDEKGVKSFLSIFG